MHEDLRATATIRQRGQLTIPDEIRAQLPWLETNNVVGIETKGLQEVIVRPFSKTQSSNAECWSKALDALKIAQSFAGKRGRLSRFVIEDRERH